MNAMDGRNGEGCHLIIVLVFKYAFSKVTTAQISWQYHVHCQKHILKLYVKQSIQNYPNHLKNLTVRPHHHMACQMNAEWRMQRNTHHLPLHQWKQSQHPLSLIVPSP
jgi:hypothetical protein